MGPKSNVHFSRVHLAQAQGDIDLGLITVYRALGGGWELRLAEQTEAIAGSSPPATEILPPTH